MACATSSSSKKHYGLNPDIDLGLAFTYWDPEHYIFCRRVLDGAESACLALP